MTFKVRVARLAVSVATAMATAGTLVTLAAAPGQAASTTGPGPVSVQTVVIPVAGQQPVQAYLVQPAGALASSSQAGILFLHWLGQIHSDRSEFLAEATELASHGAVSLLPQGIFPWVAAPHGTRKDVTAIRRQLAALQASLNYLTSRSYVDKSRVAIAGHDYGAMYSALLASRAPYMAP